MKRTCKTCEFYIENKCTNTKRKNNTISLKIISSPSWCAFKRVNRRKRKSSPRALLVKELDKLWRKAIVLRAGSRCEMTGKLGGEGRGHALNAHHIIGRSNYRVRWMLINGACLTAGAHTLAPNSAHKNPIYFLEEMIKQRGRSWYENLQYSAYNNELSNKHTIQDLQDIKKYLKEAIARYEKNE